MFARGAARRTTRRTATSTTVSKTIGAKPAAANLSGSLRNAGSPPSAGRWSSDCSRNGSLPARHLPCGRREHDMADGVSESSATRRRPRTLTYSPRGTATWRLRRTSSAVLSAKRPISRGCGWPWTPGVAKSLLSMSGIEAATARGSYGTSSRRSIANTRRFTRMLTHPTATSFPGPAPGDHQGRSEGQSRGAVQRDFTATALPLGALGVIVFKTLGPSPRGHPSLHLRL